MEFILENKELIIALVGGILAEFLARKIPTEKKYTFFNIVKFVTEFLEYVADSLVAHNIKKG